MYDVAAIELPHNGRRDNVGNAVEVNMSRVLCEALAQRINATRSGQMGAETRT